MRALLSWEDLTRLTVSDLISIMLCACNGKSTLYESFDASYDGYLVPKDSGMMFEPRSGSHERIAELNKFLSESETIFGSDDTPIYCQLAASEFRREVECHGSTIFLYPDHSGVEAHTEKLANILRGRRPRFSPGWGVRVAPTIVVSKNTAGRKFLRDILTQFIGDHLTKDTLGDLILKRLPLNHSDKELIIEAICKSWVKTGRVEVINEFNPNRHDGRLRRQIARTIDRVNAACDPNQIVGDVMIPTYCRLFNIAVGSRRTAISYDGHAHMMMLNKKLRDLKKRSSPEAYEGVCKKYCLDSSKDNPITSSVSGIVIKCEKTGLFIKTPGRFSLYSELEYLIRSEDS